MSDDKMHPDEIDQCLQSLWYQEWPGEQGMFELEKRTFRGIEQLPGSVGRMVMWKKVTRFALRPDRGQDRISEGTLRFQLYIRHQSSECEMVGFACVGKESVAETLDFSVTPGFPHSK